MTKATRCKIIKFTLYFCITLLLYCLQTTPFLFEISGVKPMMAFAFVLCIAVYEGSLMGGVFGFICGILCDFSSEMIFGANALICFLFCVGAALLMIYLVRKNVWTVTLTVTVAMLGRAVIEYYFKYGMWNYEGTGFVLWGRLIPVAIYSVVFVFGFYPLVGLIKRRLDVEI